MKQLLLILLTLALFGCKSSLSLYTATQETSLKLSISDGDSLMTIENGALYPITNGEKKFRFSIPGDSITLKMDLSHRPGTSLLLSQQIPVENIYALKSGSGLAANRENKYSTLGAHWEGSFYFFEERYDTTWKEGAFTHCEITSELSCNPDSILYLTLLSEQGASFTAAFYHPGNLNYREQIKKNQALSDSLFKNLITPVGDSLSFSFQIDAQTTEAGMVATVASIRSDSILGYTRYEYISDTIEPHEPYEVGTPSTFTITSVPSLDTVSFRLSAYKKYRDYYRTKGSSDEVLDKIKQISTCGWVPGQLFSVQRDGQYYMIEYDCPPLK